RIGARLPILGTGRCRSDITHRPAGAGRLGVVRDQLAGSEVDTLAAGDADERRRREHLAARAIDHVEVAVALRMDDHLARGAREREIEHDVLVDAIVIESIVRAELIEPARLAGIRIAREHSAGPLVVAGTQLGIPRSGIGGTVEDQVEVGIVGDESPHVAAAGLPSIGWPLLYAER